MEFGILHHQYPLHVPTIYSTLVVLTRIAAICGVGTRYWLSRPQTLLSRPSSSC